MLIRDNWVFRDGNPFIFPYELIATNNCYLPFFSLIETNPTAAKYLSLYFDYKYKPIWKNSNFYELPWCVTFFKNADIWLDDAIKVQDVSNLYDRERIKTNH